MQLVSLRFNRSSRLLKAANNNPPLKRGETGDAVAIVQMALIDLNFVMPGSTANGNRLPDGIFGPETEKTVRQFQQMNGLVADGVVGRQTLGTLERLCIAHTEAVAATTGRRRQLVAG